ncbi:hypothetical protein HY621_02010 [Candidatus Uhrbacteria bacterium]|nr:hypothetical protein [Candidatus Uhrbacteria bacterium]
MNKQKIIFAVIFTVIGFIALEVKLTNLAGSKATFTLFDAFAPIAGSFLGGAFGIVSVVVMKALNGFVHRADMVDIGFAIRLLPTLFAVWYFSSKRKSLLIVPLLAIIAFNLNPVGRQVWFFSLFWTIPIICHFLRERFLLARALGATFNAHAVGGAIWVWMVPLPASVWVGLIPVVIIERSLFALGIVGSFVCVKSLIHLLLTKYGMDLNPHTAHAPPQRLSVESPR